MPIEIYLPRTRIAYLSMEIAIRPEMHTYSGGLGVLAGDAVRSAADLELPMVFVTLASRQGYLRQGLDPHGRQINEPDPWEPSHWTVSLPVKVAVPIEGREVWIRAWLHELSGARGHRSPVILLDTDLEENDPRHRGITDRLYGGEKIDRLKQEIVLGIGGERILRALGFSIETYHLNEGHAAMLPLALLRRSQTSPESWDPGSVRKQCVFTTHTPVEAGHDRFTYEDVAHTLRDFMPIEQIKRFGGHDHLNMTTLALNLSRYVNAVSRRHGTVTQQMFPDYRVRSITNGVHSGYWTHSAFAGVFRSIHPHWEQDPEALAHVGSVKDAEIWSAHMEAKRDLLSEVRLLTGSDLDPERPVLGFARRMTGYKRPDLLFTDMQRLRAIHERFPMQIVIAGKAHPRDEGGQDIIQEIVRLSRQSGPPIVFVPGYDMDVARKLVAGCDVWLNTPLPPLEASGTSGMKAAHNGVLNLSILDGWWIEACEDGVTGWSIEHREGSREDQARALYEKLEQSVLPLYAEDRSRWIWMMKHAISRIAPVFNSHHMMRRYASEAYLS